MAALTWWHERCIEWCYDRYEPDRYGDQKYLDEFPDRFDGVRVSSHVGAGLAPWNTSSHRIERYDGGFLVDGQPLLFHHFQSLEIHRATGPARTLARASEAYRLTQGGMPIVWTTGWRLTGPELDALWEPYVVRLGYAMRSVASVLGADAAAPPPPHVTRVAFHVLRRHAPSVARWVYWRARQAIWEHRAGS
jgi:hypothetical protein